MSGRRRRRRVATAGVLLALVLAGVGVVLVLRTDDPPAALDRCLVTSRGGKYTLDVTQTRLATTITAVGKRRGLPNHAVTIALATVLQESGLRNLEHGHLDSVGLFQQRPSQGWGTVEQLQDPRYAAARFYAALEDVRGWEQMPVTVAAQQVQRSAFPNGYAKFESQARVMASALTGEVPAGLTCDVGPAPPRTGPLGEQLLRAEIEAELGRGAVGVPPNEQRGWTVANWLVSRAHGSGITSVRYADRTWFRDRRVWLPTPPVAAVSFTLAP
jgi:hypothetical protein